MHQDQEGANLSLKQIKHMADKFFDSSAPHRDMRELIPVTAAILDLHKHNVVTIPKLLPKDIRPYTSN